MRALLAFALLGATAGTAGATGVTVFLERGGMTGDRGWGETVTIPKFGGTTRTWNAVASCVREKFAAFDVEIVESRPASGPFITAVIGGRAEQLGFDGDRVAGVGVTDVRVTRDGMVHVFSKTIGERDVRQLCSVAAHEIGHAMGLDHSMQCGDLMSYPRPECGRARPETFMDVDAACGEFEERECHTGADTQNSFRRLARLVGLKQSEPEESLDEEAEPPFEPEPSFEPEPPFEPDPDAEPQVEGHHECSGSRRASTRQRRYRIVRWVIIRGR